MERGSLRSTALRILLGALNARRLARTQAQGLLTANLAKQVHTQQQTERVAFRVHLASFLGSPPHDALTARLENSTANQGKTYVSVVQQAHTRQITRLHAYLAVQANTPQSLLLSAPTARRGSIMAGLGKNSAKHAPTIKFPTKENLNAHATRSQGSWWATGLQVRSCSVFALQAKLSRTADAHIVRMASSNRSLAMRTA